MIVMKFGGTSVQNSDAMSRVISIVRERLESRPIVVVSALSKITDLLYKVSDTAAANDEAGAVQYVEELRKRHLQVAEELLSKSNFADDAYSKINDICDSLIGFIDAVCVVGDLSPRSKARIISTGEILSSTIICFAMNAAGIKTNLVDARRMIITDDDFLKGEPDKEAISKAVPQVVEEAFKSVEAIVTQGFVSATADGETTVLGRGGSDYSASLIGMGIDAERVEIWTDVNGVMTADPRVVASPKTLKEISFEEAAEMAHFGAKVLHPMTIEPAVRKNIPIYVLNSMNPGDPGTGIFSQEKIEDGLKAISSKENIYVINIFSTKMVNTVGFLNKVFEVFSRNKVSVDMISTSEVNISVTVDSSQNIEGLVAELSEFATVTVDKDKAQISVIGKNLLSQPDLFADIFSTLKGKKVYMVSQGATFINLSFVVDKEICKSTLSEIHDKIFAKK